MELTDGARTLAAILVFSLVTVETGGLYLVRLVRGAQPATAFQRSFARAGHAHAGVLLILALVGLLYAELAGLPGGWLGVLARSGVPVAAILMPGGFFFSSLRAGATEPNRLIVLVYLGAVSLAAGLIALGIGLLTTG
jgi:hypothetical protein